MAQGKLKVKKSKKKNTLAKRKKEAKANKFIGYKKNNPVKTLTKKGKSGSEIKFL